MLSKALLFLLFFVSGQLPAQYKNLVFEGGGVRGLAYAGAVGVLEEKNIIKNIEKVAGTSAGSIMALMISLGYNAGEIDSMMRSLKIQQFNDGRGGLIGKYTRVKKFYGIHKGNVFENWLELLIKRKTGNRLFNFYQLDSLQRENKLFKNLYCVGSNLTMQRAEIFCVATTPQMPLKTAVRISCSIPLFYEPVILDSTGREKTGVVKGENYQVYADGGIMANYPINIFDSCINGGNPLFCDSIIYNYQTLGVKLDRTEQIDQLPGMTNIPPYNINNLTDYMGAFMNLVMETLNRKPNLANEKDRTIYIGYGNIFSKPRKMRTAEKHALFESGRQAANKFLQEKERNAMLHN